MSVLTGVIEAARAYYESTGHCIEEMRVPRSDWLELCARVPFGETFASRDYAIIEAISGPVIVRPR